MRGLKQASINSYFFTRFCELKKLVTRFCALVVWLLESLARFEGLLSLVRVLAPIMVACEQALLFGQVKRASRERTSEGPRKGELATISHKFSFPPRKPRDSAKRENCHRKRAACQVSLDSRGRVELFIYKSLSQQHQSNVFNR